MRVLFLTHRLPYPPHRGDRIRAFHILRTLAPGMEVDLVSLVHDRTESDDVAQLRSRLGVRVTPVPVPYYSNRMAAALTLGGSRPLTHILLNSPDIIPAITSIVRERPPDVVLAYCSGMAQFALQTPLVDYPLVIDLVDLDSLKWADLAEKSGPPMRWIYKREARLLGAFERTAVRRARASLVVNDREADAVRAAAPDANVVVLPIGVELDALRPRTDPVNASRIVFCGVMNYEPNVRGVLWFAREVWPLVRKLCPPATLTIVGSDPTEPIRRLASASSGIEVTGRVPDVSPYLWNAALSIAPLQVARGVQNKVLEAVAAGLPTVVTSAVFEGLPNEIRIACRLADSPEDFARQTSRLLRMTGHERRAMASRANCAVLSWERQMAPLGRILADAAAASGSTAPPAT